MTTEKTPVRAKFQARFLPMIAPFMAAQDIRYYLNGFLIERAERGGVYLVATNGHALAAIHDPQGVLEGEERIIIRREPNLARACKARRSVIPQSVLVSDGRVIVAPDFEHIGSELETYVMPGKAFVFGNYPDWRKVLPDFTKLQPGLRSSLANPEYFALFEKIAKEGSRQYPSIRFWQRDDANTSMVIQVPAVPEFFGVVMPMHDYERDQQESLKRLEIFTK